MSKYIDLSHTIEDGLITYKGLPAPIICDYMSREEAKTIYGEDTPFQIGKIEMVSNTGTYIDCPFHRFEHGKDLAALDLDDFTNLEGILINAENITEIGLNFLKGINVKGKAVLIHSGWSKHWNTDQYFENHSYLTTEAAIYLRNHGAKLVGIDSLNIDDTRQMKRPVHTTLLGADILIVEHMTNLHLLNNQKFTFSAIPPKIIGMGSFPVRAFATIT